MTLNTLMIDSIANPAIIDGLVRSFFELFGMELVVDVLGPLPVLAGTFGVLAITFGIMFGIPDFIKRRFSRSSTSTNQGISDTEQEWMDEALSRLDSKGIEPTASALQDEVEEIKNETEKQQDNIQSPAIQDLEEREIADTLAIASESVEEEKSYIKRNGKFVRSLIISSYPGRVQFGWLDRLFTASVNIRVSYHISPRDPSKMKSLLNIRAARITSRLRQKQRKSKVNTKEEESLLNHINRLRDGLTEGSLSIFDFAIYLEVIADTEEELENATGQISQILQQSDARVVPLYDRQKDAQNVTAPLGKDTIRNTQLMDSSSLATTFPFIEPSVVHESGVLFGFHRITNTPVVVDRFDGPNLSGNNMLISGKVGSGKSYFAKLETWRRLMIDSEVEVLIIDPVGGDTGFTDLVQGLDGQRITVDGESVINPLEIRQTGEDSRGDAYEHKIQSVLGMCKSSFRGDLDKQQEGILVRALRFAYLKKGITPDPSTHDKENPTMQDVLNILKEMSQGKSPRDFMDVPPDLEGYISAIEMETGSTTDESEAPNEFVQRNREKEATYAQDVWLGLEDFQEGGQNSYLNGHTTVDIDARVVQFDISAAVDKGGAPLLMHVVLDWLFQRTKGSDVRNQVVIDEAHYMLGQDNSLDMLELFARHSRHYDSGLSLISQTVAEFLKNEQTRAIYGQCDIRALMRHEDLGTEECEALGMTEQERQFVLQAKAGNTADHSEALMHIGEIGKVRLQVLSNPFEHAVIDDNVNPWAYMYDAGIMSWWDMPEEKQEEAWGYLSDESRREIESEYEEMYGDVQ